MYSRRLNNQLLIVHSYPWSTTTILLRRCCCSTAYFQRTWMSGSFSLDLWSHYDNIGPRTTNLAEGWHNFMNHSFRIPRPSMRNFLDWLQKCQFSPEAYNLTQDDLRRRDCTSTVELDQRIASTKMHFGMRVRQLFTYTFPHPSTYDLLHQEIIAYLRHASYLIAGNDT